MEEKLVSKFVDWSKVSYKTLLLACEQALCLGKGWKYREEREGKGWGPVDKHLGPLFHGTRCASDSDASSFSREHWL